MNTFKLLTILIVLSLSASAEYIRSATETYPGGGTGGGVSAEAATNIAHSVVSSDVAPWAIAGQPKPSGGGVTTNAVNDLIDAREYVTAAVTNGLASEAWVVDKKYVTESVTNVLAATVGWHIGNMSNPHGVTAEQVGAYKKPTGGIPKGDLASDVQTSLGKADTALQSYTETDPTWTSEKSNYLTTSVAASTYQPKGAYLLPPATNATLVAAKTYTDQQVASIAGVTPQAVTNIALSVSSDVVDSRIVGDRLVWTSPDEWYIAYDIISTSVSVTNGAGYVDEWHRCITQSVTHTTKTLQAQCSAVLTDELSINVPTGIVWTCETSGGSITQSGLFTANTPNIYNIKAVDSLDRQRHAYIAIQQPVQRTDINYSYYADDASGFVRKSVNDQAYSVLNSATSAGTYNWGGKIYTLYNTFVPRMTSVGIGNSSCFAVSAHVLASAQHWGWNKPLGTQTFDDGAGHSSTVTKTAWVKLSDWAIDHGFSKSEVSEAKIGDIALITCDSSAAVPDGCIPYFIRPETREAWFGPSLEGASGWFFSQSHNQAIPVVFDTDGAWSNASTPIMNTYHAARADIKSKLVSMGQQYIVHTGDSGKPVFIRKDGHDIIVSAFHTPAGGPCYIEGFKIIKAFVESVGDTLKEAN